jgi:MFS family permease
LFVLASALVIVGQLPATRWARGIGGARAIVLGFGVMAASFAVVALAIVLPIPPSVWPAVVFVVLLTAGQMLAVPIAQDLVPRLAGERRLGAYFGVLSSAGGIAVLLGSTAVGALLDPAVGPPVVPWLVMAAVPVLSAVTIALLARRGALS